VKERGGEGKSHINFGMTKRCPYRITHISLSLCIYI